MENLFNHALLVLTSNSRNHANLLRTAKQILAKNGQISVLYITPKFPPVAFHIPEIAQYAQMQENVGKGVLSELAQSLHLNPNNLLLRNGSIKPIIKQVAKDVQANMIIADFNNWNEHDNNNLIDNAITWIAKKFQQQQCCLLTD